MEHQWYIYLIAFAGAIIAPTVAAAVGPFVSGYLVREAGPGSYGMGT